jgi:DNA-binding transcriptional ArsR family regulator
MKAVLVDDHEKWLVDALAALGSPARFRILEILAQQPQSIVAEIVSQLPLAQSTVSQHLKVLQQAGLIFDEQPGTGRCCSVNLEAVTRLAQAMVTWTVRMASSGRPCQED